MSTEQRYHVRALDRSIAVLTMLNQHNGLSPTELGRLVDLPRATVLRLLNTLDDVGYVMRSESDGCYRVTRQLRELSCGYQEESCLTRVIRPFLEDLEAQLIWPLAVMRFHGKSLIVEALTDHSCQMVERRDSAGLELSPISSTSGYLFMALLPDSAGEELTQHAIREGAAMMERLDMTAEDVRDLVTETRTKGFASMHLATHSAISVPVWIDGHLAYALNMRMHGTLDARRTILGRYIADLQSAAADLAGRIAEFCPLRVPPPQQVARYG